MHQKQITRYRRAKRARAKMRELGAHRLAVHRTPRHIYAQIIAPDGDRTIAAASTLQDDVRAGLSATGNVAAATAVGKAIAEKAKAAGVENVAFDRSGFAYHGRISALADAARGAGLKF